MTQGELAKKLGIPRSYLNGILRFKRVPSRNLAKKISKFTGIPWIYFRPNDLELLKELEESLKSFIIRKQEPFENSL